MQKPVIIGRGAFGSALAHVYGVASPIGRDNAQWRDLFASAQSQSQSQSRTLLVAVPTQSLRQVLARIMDHGGWRGHIALCCKGIERDSGLLPTEIAQQVGVGARVLVLAGPGFAADLSQGKPAAHTLAGPSDTPELLAQAAALSTPQFRVYASQDPIGVQWCGALKNIIAMAAGMAHGLALGESARAALVTRGAVEMARIVSAQGGTPETLWSLAGIGDLMLTCGSDSSRNFRFGQAVATAHGGQTPQEALTAIGTVEGFYALDGLRNRICLDRSPICQGLVRVLFNNEKPGHILNEWMTRRDVTFG